MKLFVLFVLMLLYGVKEVFQAQAYHYQFAATVGALKRLNAPLVVLWAFLFFRDEEGEGIAFLPRIAGSTIALSGALVIGLSG